MQSGADGPLWDAQGNCDLLGRQTLPYAEREHVLLDLGQHPEHLHQSPRLLLVGEMINRLLGEVALIAWPGQPRERRPISTLPAPLVPHHVGGDAVEPRQLRFGCEFHCAPSSPGFEEHHRGQILSQLAIRRAAEAVSIDPLRVLVPQPHMPDGICRASDRPAADRCHHLLYVRTPIPVRGSQDQRMPEGPTTSIVGAPRGVGRLLLLRPVIGEEAPDARRSFANVAPGRVSPTPTRARSEHRRR